MEFHIIDKYEDFCLLEDDWEDLLTRIENPQVFYKFQWAKNYLEYYASEWKNRICIVAGYDDKKLVVLFPFVLEKRVIRFITSETVDYNMVYVDGCLNRFSVIKKGIVYLMENKEIDRFDLNGFVASSELYLLEEILREQNYSAFIEEITIAPTIKANENAREKFNKERMRGIYRRGRKLEREHELEIKYSNELREDVLTFIVKHKTFKYNDSTLKNGSTVDFYRNLCKSLPSETYIAELYLDGKLAAAHLGFRDDNKIYYYIPTYDEKYVKDGVGMVLLNKLIEEDLGIKEFDFLKGNEEYKFYFSDEVCMIFNLFAFKKGSTHTIMQRTMNALKNNHFVRKIMGR